ncbi:MAG TPA: hypothetical protein VMW17_20335 [Candidatus Binatia bacterium]|nr:hypothetical protein [Candidatus Binatia bacterium]
MTSRHDGAVVVALAAVAHFSFAWETPAVVWPDSVRYANLAYDLTRRFRTADWDLFTTPGYPIFLWWCRHWIAPADGVAWVQQGLAICACWLIWLAVRRTSGRRPALAAGIVVALSPFRHYYAQSLLTECVAECALVAGVGLAVPADVASTQWRLVTRAASGAVLGLATLVRANLAVAAAVLWLLPLGQSATRRAWFAGVSLSGLGWLVVVAPWLGFNLQRGVDGLAGSSGYLFNEYANFHRVGGTVVLPPELTPETDRELQHRARQRVRDNLGQYLRAVAKTAKVFLFPFPLRGDVAPAIPECLPPPRVDSLAGFSFHQSPSRRTIRWWIHRGLSSAYQVLITLSWIGLGAWGIRAAIQGRWDAALIAAAAFVGVAALSLMLLVSTRYAFPYDTLALGFGIPGGWSVAAEVGKRARARRRDLR